MNGDKLSIVQLKNDLNASWAIAKKDVKIYYLTPPTLMFGILFPLFMFLAFAVGRNAPVTTLIPGRVSITLLFSTSSIGPAVIPTERRVKTYDRLLSAPISSYLVMVGKTLSGFLFGLAIGVIMIITSLLLFQIEIISAPSLIIGFVLSAFCFAMLGIMLAMFPRENPGDIMLPLNFIRLPLIFVSGIFIPIESMPYWGQVAAVLSPLTYANDLVRFAYEGRTIYGPVLDAVVLIFFTVVFLAIGRKIESKFRE
jgi:ABC-2 type transport system permease protein